jgi:hypothetical protein
MSNFVGGGEGEAAAEGREALLEAKTAGKELESTAVTQLHHIFPQSKNFRSFFTDKKINIHNYTVPLERRFHLSTVHGTGKWNDAWKTYINGAGKSATPEEVKAFAKDLSKRYGIDPEQIIKYGSRKPTSW